MKIQKLINVHTHKVVSQGFFIYNLFPDDIGRNIQGRLFSTGLHPWHIEDGKVAESLAIVRNFAALESCLAIGETGLDKLTNTPFELQLSVFKSHIQIAEDLNKPIIIHCVKAFSELITIKKNTKAMAPWIVHGFNSKPAIATELINQGMKLSFGKALTQSGSNAIRTLRIIPVDAFFLETDEGEIPITKIYDHAANILNIEMVELQKIITLNFNKTFGTQDE